MESTKNLPAGYKAIFTIDFVQNKAAMWWMNIFSFLMLIVFGVGFARISMRLRPELWAVDGSPNPQGNEILSLLIAAILMSLLHESCHALFYWIYNHEKPEFGFSNGFFFTAASEWYIPRITFIQITLAPFIFLSLIGSGLMSLLPISWIPGLIFFLTLNAAGSMSDFFTIAWIAYRPSEVLINDLGTRIILFGLE